MAILLVSRHHNNTVNSEFKNELVFEGIRYLRNALGCENWKRAHATQTQNKRRKNLKENATWSCMQNEKCWIGKNWTCKMECVQECLKIKGNMHKLLQTKKEREHSSKFKAGFVSLSNASKCHSPPPKKEIFGNNSVLLLVQSFSTKHSNANKRHK